LNTAPYQALADLIILVHIAFIVFVLFGGLLAFRWRWMPWRIFLPLCGAPRSSASGGCVR